MLVLTRKLNESIIVGDDIRITVVGIRGHHVRLGIEAPESVGIFREEILGRTEADDSRVMTGPFGLETRRVGP